jgi:pyroglutamyl-peptidase
MRDALVARGIPCTVSNHAGAYVCNHVFYVARDGIERLSLPTLCGFIHVPPVEKLPLEMSIDAIGECITLACAAKKNAGRG